MHRRSFGKASGRSLLAAALLALPGTGAAEMPQMWTPDPGGAVTAIARLGNTLYFGGTFHALGPPTGSGVPVSAVDGTPAQHFAKVAGNVEAVVEDGAGGWYIGGSFAGVGGLPRANLAHVFADGRVDAWDPGPDGIVYALARAGSRLYVGGDFQHIGGRSRGLIAAFDLATGSLLPWNPQVGGEVVYPRVCSILVEGNSCFIGGAFGTVGRRPRANAAEVSVQTGQVTGWNPGANGVVLALARHGHTIYLGGQFNGVGGALRRYLAAVDVQTGQVTDWDALVHRVPDDYLYDGGARVSGLAVARNTLYIAGAFNRVGDATRAGLAAVDLHTGALTGWDPQGTGFGWDLETPNFRCILVHGETVYVGGQFVSLGGMSTDFSLGAFAAALDARTGRALDWNPRPNQRVHALAMSGNQIFLGGEFNCVRDWIERFGLAALDLATGKPTTWAPDPDGLIRTMVAGEDRIYVGGGFSRVGGQPRANLAALDPVEGRATDWNPGSNGGVWTLACAGDRIYAGGMFTRIGGAARDRIAALGVATGAATPWNPGADRYIVETICVSGSKVYIGGLFKEVGGVNRIALAAIDASSGEVTAWNPDPDGAVLTLAAAGGTVFAGGFFENIGGQPRARIAALDTLSGAATAWSADVTGSGGFLGATTPQVWRLVAADGAVYFGGSFGSVEGLPRTCLAAADIATGTVLPWNPDPSSVVYSMAADGDAVYVGGAFTRMGVSPMAHLAAVEPAPHMITRPIAAAPASLVQRAAAPVILPNPLRSFGVIRFELPSATPVRLDVYDVQGRHVANLLPGDTRPAGPHEVSVSTRGWSPGCYLARLDVAGRVTTTRMLVVR